MVKMIEFKKKIKKDSLNRIIIIYKRFYKQNKRENDIDLNINIFFEKNNIKEVFIEKIKIKKDPGKPVWPILSRPRTGLP